jgi:hypothetical protein
MRAPAAPVALDADQVRTMIFRRSATTSVHGDVVVCGQSGRRRQPQ